VNTSITSHGSDPIYSPPTPSGLRAFSYCRSSCSSLFLQPIAKALAASPAHVTLPIGIGNWFADSAIGRGRQQASFVAAASVALSLTSGLAPRRSRRDRPASPAKPCSDDFVIAPVILPGIITGSLLCFADFAGGTLSIVHGFLGTRHGANLGSHHRTFCRFAKSWIARKKKLPSTSAQRRGKHSGRHDAHIETFHDRRRMLIFTRCEGEIAVTFVLIRPSRTTRCRWNLGPPPPRHHAEITAIVPMNLAVSVLLIIVWYRSRAQRKFRLARAYGKSLERGVTIGPHPPPPFPRFREVAKLRLSRLIIFICCASLLGSAATQRKSSFHGESQIGTGKPATAGKPVGLRATAIVRVGNSSSRKRYNKFIDAKVRACASWL